MTSKAHFVKLWKGLHRQWMNDVLLDLKLVAVDRPVGMHKVVLIVFSTFYQQLYAKTGHIPDIEMRDYTSDQVCKLLDFLYSGETTDGVPMEMIRHLKLDLSIEQPKSLSEKVNLNEEKLKQFTVIMEYLRSYTLETEVRKLLYNNRAWSDVIIRTGKYVHKCHKVILSALSAYFEVMFSSGMKEADEKIINLHGVKAKIFSDVLTFIYTGGLDISVCTAQELLTTSVYLQIPDLQLFCENFLLHQMDMRNCVDMLKLGRLYNCHTLESGSYDFIVDNFDNIGKHKLKGLDKEEVLVLLSHDNLNVVDEKAVLMFVLRWTMDNKSARETQLSRLLQKVRLTLLKPDYLTELVNNNEVINKNETCVKLVKESIDKIHKGEIDVEPRKGGWHQPGGCGGEEAGGHGQGTRRLYRAIMELELQRSRYFSELPELFQLRVMTFELQLKILAAKMCAIGHGQGIRRLYRAIMELEVALSGCKIRATRKGIALKFDEFRKLTILLPDIVKTVPELTDIQSCYMRSGHFNQLDALSCFECNPNGA